MSAIDKIKAILKDSQKYMESLLKIRTKRGDLVKFKLNSSQKRLNDKINELQAMGKPVRIIILKARQMGFSTLTEGRIFHKTATTKLTNSFIIAHKEEASTNLFSMSKLFYEELPLPLRPMKKASNAKELIFENPTPDLNEKQTNPGLRSKIKIDTAKNLDAGRSSTIHNLHASEVAFWDNADTVMLGLMQAVPNTPNTMAIIESTANGVGGYFYDMWQKAKRGENDFIPLFFAWYEHDEYQMEVPSGFTLTDEEQELKELYHLKDEQIVWRRWAIRNNCGGDVEKFKQEYPSHDEEAFLTSGRPRFDVQTLHKWYAKAVPGERGYIEHKKWVPDDKGYLEIWEQPQPNRWYVIGADTSEGKVNGDYSTATVWDIKTYKQVAKWHGHIDPDLFGDELSKLGYYYNTALIAPEKNNHGFTTINKLKNLNYPNVFQMERYDETSDKTTKELGFLTNRKTKPLIIDNMARMIRESLIETKDKDLISECITYIREDDGGTNAQEGCHDDLVMASAIALFVMSNYVGEYYEYFENTTFTPNKDKHLPFALQDDIDTTINWNDL
ncbi:DNA packaging protein [Peribacillus acanthi]|uniref:DNA packaging protein n=1 Tax=Peribacillus acanthi TaxID=2171554 RepID=UPI000D3E440B|nr:DNA packaging protein [Peribacillus acanthi]